MNNGVATFAGDKANFCATEPSGNTTRKVSFRSVQERNDKWFITTFSAQNISLSVTEFFTVKLSTVVVLLTVGPISTEVDESSIESDGTTPVICILASSFAT